MILQIKKIEQQDDECGPASVAEVLDFYKIPYVMQDIIDYTSNCYKYRDWDYLMGQYLLKNGLKPQLITFQSLIYDPSWNSLSQKNLLSKLKEELQFFCSESPRLQHKGFKAWHQLGPEISEIEEAIKFIEMGGEVVIKPLSCEDISTFLARGYPIICAYDAILLHGKKRGFMGKPDDIGGVPMGHVSVISGYNKDNFKIIDPSYWYRPEEFYWINKNRLLNSIMLRNSQYLVCIK